MTKETLDSIDIEVDKPFIFNGKAVTVWQDDCASNPWDDMDCCTPVIFSSDRRNGSYTVSDYGDRIVFFFDHVSPQWATLHRAAICSAMDIRDPDSFDKEARAATRKGYSIANSRHDLFTEQLLFLSREAGCSNFLDILARLYRILGWTVRRSTEYGYCQGDVIEVLLVSTPAHLKRCGGKRKAVESTMEGEAAMLAAWAFGDVYGFTVTDDDDDEESDSCGGFYGPYYTRDSGLLEAIEEACS